MHLKKHNKSMRRYMGADAKNMRDRLKSTLESRKAGRSS